MQEIIVYRSPIEAAMYQHMPEIVLFVTVTISVMFGCITIGEILFLPEIGVKSKRNRMSVKDSIAKISIVVGILAGCVSLTLVQF